ncbi:MAG: hypothetical protein M1817_002565 [Caeruleum heppii]|nr:MAG: hypothetical protein M1817_002565 [Caeruleum heppii]
MSTTSAPSTNQPPTTTSTSPPSTSSPASTPAHLLLTTALSHQGTHLTQKHLEPRASALHANAAQLAAQEAELKTATAGLARHEDPLQKEAEKAARQIKELGDVQNWAEMLEVELAALEECVRVVEEEKEGPVVRANGGEVDAPKNPFFRFVTPSHAHRDSCHAIKDDHESMTPSTDKNRSVKMSQSGVEYERREGLSRMRRWI